MPILSLPSLEDKQVACAAFDREWCAPLHYWLYSLEYVAAPEPANSLSDDESTFRYSGHE